MATAASKGHLRAGPMPDPSQLHYQSIGAIKNEKKSHILFYILQNVCGFFAVGHFTVRKNDSFG